MSENSVISWIDHTFNPWIGCAKVSPGCEHCYAETDFDLRKGIAQWGAGKAPHRRRQLAPSVPVEQRGSEDRLSPSRLLCVARRRLRQRGRSKVARRCGT
jgi:hypothetical protein